MKTLPNFFKPLFWSYDFSSLDPEKNKKTVVISTINYGDMRHWKWLARHYGKSAVRNLLAQSPASALRPPARRLAKLLFDVKFKNISRGSH